eukprot:6195245-Pleurochrysis_carterae.AAC.1
MESDRLVNVSGKRCDRNLGVAPSGTAARPNTSSENVIASQRESDHNLIRATRPGRTLAVIDLFKRRRASARLYSTDAPPPPDAHHSDGHDCTAGTERPVLLSGAARYTFGRHRSCGALNKKSLPPQLQCGSSHRPGGEMDRH